MALDQHAQVVQLVEGVEVQRRHLPAELREHLHEAFLLQPLQGLAQRRAAHGDALGEFGLGEAVARHQLEIEDQLARRLVGLLGERSGGRSAEGATGVVHSVESMRLTCAATIFQPTPAKRTQVWLCRPSLWVSLRRNCVCTTAKSRPKLLMRNSCSVRVKVGASTVAR